MWINIRYIDFWSKIFIDHARSEHTIKNKKNLGITPEYISTIPTSCAILPTLSYSAYLLCAQRSCNSNFFILCLFILRVLLVTTLYVVVLLVFQNVFLQF